MPANVKTKWTRSEACSEMTQLMCLWNPTFTGFKKLVDNHWSGNESDDKSNLNNSQGADIAYVTDYYAKDDTGVISTICKEQPLRMAAV